MAKKLSFGIHGRFVVPVPSISSHSTQGKLPCPLSRAYACVELNSRFRPLDTAFLRAPSNRCRLITFTAWMSTTRLASSAVPVPARNARCVSPERAARSTAHRRRQASAYDTHTERTRKVTDRCATEEHALPGVPAAVAAAPPSSVRCILRPPHTCASTARTEAREIPARAPNPDGAMSENTATVAGWGGSDVRARQRS